MDENKLGSHWDEDDFLAESDRLWEAELASDTLPNDNRQKFPCVRCGRLLTNHKSIERGIGPICAENFGF